LKPGGPAHQLCNNYTEECIYLEIGLRDPEDVIMYLEDRIVRKDNVTEPLHTCTGVDTTRCHFATEEASTRKDRLTRSQNVSKAELLSDLAEQIAQVRRSHLTRVAIDGVDAAGKTVLASVRVYQRKEIIYV
jgi:hypothetical protein